jgi:hypothetical protein
MLQLNPPLEVETPKGRGYAEILIDYGLESDLYFVCILNNGEIWTFKNIDIRVTKNITAGRTNV